MISMACTAMGENKVNQTEAIKMFEGSSSYCVENYSDKLEWAEGISQTTSIGCLLIVRRYPDRFRCFTIVFLSTDRLQSIRRCQYFYPFQYLTEQVTEIATVAGDKNIDLPLEGRGEHGRIFSGQG